MPQKLIASPRQLVKSGHRVFQSRASPAMQKKNSTGWKKVLFRSSLAVVGAGVVYDGLNEFEFISGGCRFFRSLKIAVQITIDYSWSLYGISTESEQYEKVGIGARYNCFLIYKAILSFFKGDKRNKLTMCKSFIKWMLSQWRSIHKNWSRSIRN